MIKILLVLFPALILFITGPSFNSDDKIKIEQDFPTYVEGGDIFIATITIHKTEMDGWGRLQQDLPPGFSAEVIDSHGAEFLVENNSVKFIWLKMPVENDFKVSYRVKTEKNITGKQYINGVFMFIQDDKTERLPLASTEIIFGENLTAEVKGPTVDRKLICLNQDIGEYQVDLLFHPNGITDPAIFTDNIPSNFMAELIDARGASFTYENSIVVFNWSKLPSDSSFIISYLVRSGKAGAPPVITGTLYYGEDNNTHEQPLAKETTTSENFTDSREVTAVNQNVIDQNAPLADVKPALSNYPVSPATQNGITFKVQISATQKSSTKNNSWFESRYHLNSPVEVTLHQGWKKYLVGNFQAYAEASAFRKKTQEKISDAFVVAYENGNRISLREALRDKSINQ